MAYRGKVAVNRKVGADKFIQNEKGKEFIDVGSMIQLYGKYYKAVLDGGWGCDGCALFGKCAALKGKFGSCDGGIRPDENDIIFVCCGTNPFR